MTLALAPNLWSREACDDWIARFEGIPPGGRIGKALKPLVTRYGWVAVRPAWRRYLAASEAMYVSPQRFASTYGAWVQRGKGRKIPVTEQNRITLDEWEREVREGRR
jgi:hypothetical protein